MKPLLNKNTTDLVCGMTIDSKTAQFTTVYQGKRYYFCANACKKEFDSNPEKFVHPRSEKPKGWWGRYLDRLQKATGGKTPSCCH